MIWSILLALGVSFVTWEMAKQLYTAAMDGYILTGRSMNVRVYREEDRRLFRNNVVGTIILFPLVAGGALLLVLHALEQVGL